MNELLYGVAYYYEYLPYNRLEDDIKMLKDANINLVRIAESTWSTMEPQEGIFNFSTVDLVLEAMYRADIKVIIGTPTYAVPAWMVKSHPDIIATTKSGKPNYGARQIMDITNPAYLFYSERIIRELLNHVKDHKAIIGYQIDNETKHYGTAGDSVQRKFVKYLREKFKDLNCLNKEFGLDYWSNRVDAWEDFPSVNGTINASLACEFSKFQRSLVTSFLSWQADIVREYKKPDQFVTHNFDFDWRGYSYGVQPDVDHFKTSEVLDVVGVDIYHPSQKYLTGAEIAFCGDSSRSYKNNNYFVLETQAQGHPPWTPYPGQLRLQAFSHIASGANMVEYWHYHSIHNSFETYWKGLLSHDFKSNPVYEEAKTIGKDFKLLGSKISNLKKRNRVALLVSNESLSAFNWFKMYRDMDYNDYVRRMYDSLYKMNIECDIIDINTENLKYYDLLLVPPLYAASNSYLDKLNFYVQGGGNVIFGIRSGFSNENCKVRETIQPGIINKCCGATYQLFTDSDGISLKDGDPLEGWIELLKLNGGEALFSYDSMEWKEYAAVTFNRYGDGSATYIGCYPSENDMCRIIEDVISKTSILDIDSSMKFPIIKRSGYNLDGTKITFLFNYSSSTQIIDNSFKNKKVLLGSESLSLSETIELKPWDTIIFED